MHVLKSASLITLFAAWCLVAVLPVSAQEYPAKYVRIITGAQGAMPDIVTRQLGQWLSVRWGGKSVVVENHAQVVVSSGIAARSTPDGYTLLLADRTSHAVAPNLFKDLGYDPVKDFAPITLVARAPMMLVAHPSVPAANLREFIDYAKQRPGAIDYSGAGPGTAVHIAAELFNQVAGVRLNCIQYKGGGAALLAIVAGEVKTGFGLIPIALPQVKAGKVKAYAVASKARFAGAPDIPTMAEAGLPAFEEELWIGMFAPARTPEPVLGKLNRDIVEILKSPAMKETLLAQGAEPAPGTRGEFAAFINSETAKMKKVIETAGIRAE